MDSLDDIFELPQKKIEPQKEDPEIKKYVDDLMLKSLTDAETESDIVTPKNIEKKPRKKHNIAPEKLEIMKANLKKGRDAIKAKRDERLKGELKQQVVKEVKDELKKKIESEMIKVEKKVKVESEPSPQVVKKVESVPQVIKKVEVVPVKPYIIKSTIKLPIW